MWPSDLGTIEQDTAQAAKARGYVTGLVFCALFLATLFL